MVVTGNVIMIDFLLIQLVAKSLPFTDPVLVFSIVLLVILLSPILFSRIKIPGLVGLILSGVVLGPHGFHILARDNSIVLFGTVGLLYLMFLAGLEMDINDFRKNKQKGFVFGALTFICPFILGFIASFYILDYSLTASVLLASMFSTHTLIAYPIISKLGISQHRAVTVTISGTIITDAAVLLILAFITNLQENEINAWFFIRLFLLLSVLIFVIFWGVPRLASWFFRTRESEGYSHYLFVLAVVFLSGYAAHVIGVEPIIGAFLAGLALNQLIPHTSTLMNRIDFVGNALFIPFFLISVGMLVDVRVLLKGPEALLISALIIFISFFGKWIAAFITQKIYGFTAVEQRLIWGMSSAHAAATIAVVLIGFNLKLLDENVLNGTILLILFSCLGSSLISEKAGKKIAAEEAELIPEATPGDERILVPVVLPETLERILDFAIMIKNPRSQNPVYPLYVVPDDASAAEKMALYEKKTEHNLKDVAIESDKEPVFRVDVDVPDGIIRAVKELRITEIILAWNGELSIAKRFGTVLDKVIDRTILQVVLCKLVQPVNTIKRILVVIPQHAEKEAGFPSWVDTLLQLTKIAGARLIIYSSEYVFNAIDQHNNKGEKGLTILFKSFEHPEDFPVLTRELERHDLFIPVLARPGTVSYQPYMDLVPRYLSRYFSENSIVVLYPEQLQSLQS